MSNQTKVPQLFECGISQDNTASKPPMHVQLAVLWLPLLYANVISRVISVFSTAETKPPGAVGPLHSVLRDSKPLRGRGKASSGFSAIPWVEEIKLKRTVSIIAQTLTTTVVRRGMGMPYPARVLHFPLPPYIHRANNMTLINPAPMLVTLLFGLAGLFELLVLDEDEPVPVLPEEPASVPVGIELA